MSLYPLRATHSACPGHRPSINHSIVTLPTRSHPHHVPKGTHSACYAHRSSIDPSNATRPTQSHPHHVPKSPTAPALVTDPPSGLYPTQTPPAPPTPPQCCLLPGRLCLRAAPHIFPWRGHSPASHPRPRGSGPGGVRPPQECGEGAAPLRALRGVSGGRVPEGRPRPSRAGAAAPSRPGPSDVAAPAQSAARPRHRPARPEPARALPWATTTL